MSNFRTFIKTTVEEIVKYLPSGSYSHTVKAERHHVRLGHTIYSTDSKCLDIRTEKADGTSAPVTPETLAEKPWIVRNLQEELAFQRRKERAEMFSKSCFQRPRYSANQRIAYKNDNFNKGL